MSDATVLGAAQAEGFATVREVPAPGMIALKGDLSSPALAEAVRAVTGCAVPGLRRIEAAGPACAGWMAPDEVLLIVQRGDVPAALATIAERLSGAHHLAADVSDMRAVFRLEGAGAREALAKLAPVDLAPGAFEPGELRRTRLAQVPAAFWMEEGGITLVCFRSVARYAFDLLAGAAAPGGAVGHFA
ncbi:sarcosine oxidase subunit gamma [Rhodovulum sp. 12E13]|uniref:sarcosine oxidase subunit gamma n=1 Tax=Rhodovulum sp. 12E13 TaxID=2203891 RepID=UPI000E178640|nr:sarcosine oxidase subunit gamma family protein [Rhodovulum sp. 12E13]RDC73053.1 sarcosine oxidase subunit gamma [Rhodovulum sp. 12E13]